MGSPTILRRFSRLSILRQSGVAGRFYFPIPRVVTASLRPVSRKLTESLCARSWSFLRGEPTFNALTDIILRHTFEIADKDQVEPLARDFMAVHRELPKVVRENWHYIQIYTRIVGDAALVENDGIPSQVSDEIFSKLVKIYHAENAFYFVSPVTRKSIMENRGEGV